MLCDASKIPVCIVIGNCHCSQHFVLHRLNFDAQNAMNSFEFVNHHPPHFAMWYSQLKTD